MPARVIRLLNVGTGRHVNISDRKDIRIIQGSRFRIQPQRTGACVRYARTDSGVQGEIIPAFIQFGHQVPIEQRSLVGVINVTPVLTGDTRRGRSVYFLLILIIHIIDISTAL